MCVFPKYTIQKFIVKPQSASELVLTPLSLFDLQCKKLNLTVKTSRNVFLGDLRGSFSYFPKIPLNHGGGAHRHLLEFLCIMW